MTSNSQFDDVSGENQRTPLGPGNNSESWISSSVDNDDETKRFNHSDCEESLLPLVLSDSHSPTTRTGKRNAGRIKRGSDKFVAAIKSLQCSPRVVDDTGGYGKLKGGKTKSSSSNQTSNDSNDNASQSSNTDSNFFVANFDDLESMQDDKPNVVGKGSVSSNLELEKVLERLDSLNPGSTGPQHNPAVDDLEIFTSGTDDTAENVGSTNKHGEAKEEQHDDDIEDLRQLSGLSSSRTEESSFWRGNGAPTLATPIPGCGHVVGFPSTPTQKPLILNEFSPYSNDSNDTPVTCNKSLILTPNNERRHSGQNQEQDCGDEIDLYSKPPKEILHRSLSLGDSLSPTGDDSPCRPDRSVDVSQPRNTGAKQRKNTLRAMPTADCTDDGDNLNHDCHRTTGHPSQRQMEMLTLPVMNGRSRSSLEENVLRRVKQIEVRHILPSFFSNTNNSFGFGTAKSNQSSLSNSSPATQQVLTNEANEISTPQDEGSAVSSAVSSFVFSTDNGHNLEGTANQAVMNPQTTSSAYFWKAHPSERTQQIVNHAVLTSGHTSPAFFWKTHPRVTIKSYHFQQRKASIRPVNAKLESGRTFNHIA
jgi:hypothetical protein